MNFSVALLSSEMHSLWSTLAPLVPHPDNSDGTPRASADKEAPWIKVRRLRGLRCASGMTRTSGDQRAVAVDLVRLPSQQTRDSVDASIVGDGIYCAALALPTVSPARLPR